MPKGYASKNSENHDKMNTYFMKTEGLTLEQVCVRNMIEFFQDDLLKHNKSGKSYWEKIPQILRNFLRENGYLRNLNGVVGGRRLDVAKLEQDIPELISGDYWRG